MKKIILKILYFLSYVPLITIIYIIISSYFFGFEFFSYATYGFQAVEDALVMFFFATGYVTIPLLIGCLIYQIFYIKKLKNL